MTTTTTTPATVPTQHVAARTLGDYLQSKAEALQSVMPQNFGLDVNRLIRLAIAVCSRNRDLMDCSQSSIYSALYDAVRWGIDPVSPHGYGYIVPRWNKNANGGSGGLEATFQVGYKGLIHIARRWGNVKKIVAEVVLKDEKFVFDPVEGEVHHEYDPDLDRTNEKDYRAAYAVAWVEDGYKAAVVLGRSQVMQRKAVSATKGGMWAKWPDRMWRKTAIRALFSGGDIELSPEMIEVLEKDYENDRIEERGRIKVVDGGSAAIDAALGLTPAASDDEQGEPEPVAKLLEAELGRQQVELAEVSEHVLGRKPSSKQPLTEDEIQRIYDYMTHAEEGAAQE